MAPVAYLTSFTQRMGVILAWTGQEASLGRWGPVGAGALLPGRESSSGGSRQEREHTHPADQDEEAGQAVSGAQARLSVQAG